MAASRSRQQISVLASSTFAFTICFAIWMMFAVLGIPIKAKLGLNETQFGLLAATPVLTGSLVRVPLGIWTDKFGGRVVQPTVQVDHRLPDLGHARDQFLDLSGGSTAVGEDVA